MYYSINSLSSLVAAMIGKPLAAVIVLLILLGISGCRERDDLRKVRLWALAPPEVIPLYEEDVVPLRFAVALMISPQEGFKNYRELAEHLGKRLNRPVQLILRRTSSEVNDLVRNRQVEMAFLCSHGYVQGRKDFGLEALAVPQVGGRAFHASYVIVPADSEVEILEQLRDRVFAFADPLCSPGEPALPWRERGQLEAFSKRRLIIYGHDRAIKAVAENLVDGAVVDGMVYEQVALSYPEEIPKTKVIRRSVPYGTPPIAVHPRMNLRLKRELQGAFLTMHQDEEGKKILQKLAVDRFVPPSGGIQPP